MVYKRVRGWTSGRSLPVLNFLKFPPPPPPGLLPISSSNSQITATLTYWNPSNVDREHQVLQRSESTKHRINKVSGKKSICLKFLFWCFKYQLLQKIGRSIRQEFQNFTPWRRWLTNKNPRLRDLAAKNSRIRDARNTRKRDFETHSKPLRDFEIGTKISVTLNFLGTIRHPYSLLNNCRWIDNTLI